MNPHLAADLAQLPDLLAVAARNAVTYLEGLDERPVLTGAAIPEPAPLPEQGAGLAEAQAEFTEHWIPAMSSSPGPRYFGFVTGGATPAALAGDWMTAALDQNSMSALDGAGQELERQTVAWLRDLFGLTAGHKGTFVSGATMSNTVGLAIAREWLGEHRGVSVAQEGVGALGTVRVLSGSPHSSIAKAVSMLGLGRNALVRIPVLAGREAVDLEALQSALENAQAKSSGSPCIVVANAGTVNTVDFDDLLGIAALKERYGFWLHVDAAFGAFAALSPADAHLVAGFDAADSVCVDLHKWLNVPYDSAVQFTRRPDLQAKVFQNAAAYLGPLGDTPDLVHLTPENSRRLRAIAAWFTLRAYGRDGHRDIVERDIAAARALGNAIEANSGLRLLAPVRLNVVCFTLAGDPTAERLAALVEDLSDVAFFTPTVYAGVPALRAAFSNWRTTAADVQRTIVALAKTQTSSLPSRDETIRA